MSGGHFNYQQSVLDDIAESIEKLIEENDTHGQYSNETLKQFLAGATFCRVAAVMAQRIDWLVCGDDGELTFHERLASDLKQLSEHNFPQIKETR